MKQQQQQEDRLLLLHSTAAVEAHLREEEQRAMGKALQPTGGFQQELDQTCRSPCRDSFAENFEHNETPSPSHQIDMGAA